MGGTLYKQHQSLSARRAWIEIGRSRPRCSASCVALRKESVDRNGVCAKDITDKKQSLSARRAWIEIGAVTHMQIGIMVALRKESVDRNRKSTPGIFCCNVALRKESVDRNGVKKRFDGF